MFERIIFLDIDGVLVVRPTDGEFSPGAVGILREIVVASGAKIVISSAWRRCSTWRSNILKAFRAAGWNDPPIVGRTSVMSGGRGEEISAWLKVHPAKSILIIDDIDIEFSEEQKKRLIHCDEYAGLKEEHIQLAAEKWAAQ